MNDSDTHSSTTQIEQKYGNPSTEGESENTGVRLLAKEAILIGALTLIGAITAMAFEVGYATIFFKVPVELIEINAQRVLIVALLTSFVAAPLLMYLQLGYASYKDGRPLVKVVGGVMLVASPVVMFLPFIAISVFQWYFFGGLAAVAVILSVFSAIYSRIRHGRPVNDGLRDAAEEIVQLWDHAREPREYTAVDLIWGCFVCAVIPLLWVMAVGARIPAYCEHLVLSDKPNYVFVRRYGDNFVFKEFSPVTGAILTGIEIRSAQSEKPLLMHATQVRLKGWWHEAEKVQPDSDAPADALAPENVPR